MNLKAIAIVMVLGFLVACDQAPSGPTTEDFNNERQALMKDQGKPKPPVRVAQAADKSADGAKFGILVDGYTYDRTTSKQ